MWDDTWMCSISWISVDGCVERVLTLYLTGFLDQKKCVCANRRSCFWGDFGEFDIV